MWDLEESKREPKNLTYEDFVNKSDIIFISVPTPMNKKGECYLGIVEDAVSSVKKINANKDIVIRSTVIPGTSDRLCFVHA